MLVGNKNDLSDRRQVTLEYGQAKAKEYGVMFIETSAKNSTNVEKAFLAMASQIKQRMATQPLAGGAPANVVPKLDGEEVQSGCC